MTPPPPIVVLKLGGSLLDWPPWPGRLRSFLDTLPECRPVLVVGGGRFADHLRDLDRLHGLGEEASHALALRALDLTAHLAAALLLGSDLAADLADLPPLWAAGRLPILAPRRVLDADDRSADPLPHRWTTTTDSIAARVATLLGAAELVLLKSAPTPPDVADWADAAARGLVDPEFPRAAAGLTLVRVVDLRGATASGRTAVPSAMAGDTSPGPGRPLHAAEPDQTLGGAPRK